MNHRLIIRNAVFAALVLGAPLAHPITSTFRQGVNGYTGTVDTYLRMDQPTSRFEGATIVLVDNDAPIAHGLIRFDNIFGSGPGQVPSNSYTLIESARLTFRTSNDGDPVWFHRMLVPWAETNNWNELSTSGPGLQADNIEMSAVPDFTFTGSTPIPRVDSFDVTATVRSWLAGDFPNYGWGITNQIANGWQFDSSENTNVNNRPALEIVWFYGEPVIRIVRHPQSSTNAEGSAVVLSVLVDGTDPRYQWSREGTPVSDATNSSYAIPVVRRTDAGSYTVYVSNPISQTMTSNPAILTVIPDETPPSLTCAYGTNNLLTIFVEFSEIVTNATELVYWAVFPSDGGEYLTVRSAAYSGGGTQDRTVVLTLDPATPIVPGRSYLLNVGGVSDRFGNVVDPTRVISIALYSQSIFSISDPRIWKFNDRGTDLGTAWRNANYNDDSWPSGLPLLGFETAPLPEPLRTPLSRTNAAGFSIRTYYFRTHFDSFASGAGLLRFRTVLDDTAAIYLNGAEIFRIRMPAGPLDYMTPGAGAAVGNAVYEGPFTVCVSNLVFGDNVLAVEVHQTGDNSSDLVFGMELAALLPDPPPQLNIALSPDGNEILLTWTGSAKLEQTSRLNPSEWSEVEGAIGGYRTPKTGMRFFRLREP